MNIFFILLVIVHMLIWIFVLLAFFDKRTAKINLYYIIPLIFILHTFLPFHIIEVSKEMIYPEDTKQKVNYIEEYLIIPPLFYWLKDNVFGKSFCNPLSPQGMLIFGAITSAYKIKNSK